MSSLTQKHDSSHESVFNFIIEYENVSDNNSAVCSILSAGTFYREALLLFILPNYRLHI